ncbi:hypothetical protein ABTX85_37130 [Streptomyces sp. NPDC096097]|uniref:hypothetical protein n=1 Tax=Streptomyces sp. NPDC096097 TaxID=3155546 RepID=UPI0033241285
MRRTCRDSAKARPRPAADGSLTLALLLFGGPALYLATTAWFFHATAGGAWKERLLAAAVLAVIGTAAVWLAPLASLVLLDIILITTAVILTRTRRTRIPHGPNDVPPSRSGGMDGGAA